MCFSVVPIALFIVSNVKTHRIIFSFLFEFFIIKCLKNETLLCLRYEIKCRPSDGIFKRGKSFVEQSRKLCF